MAFSFEPFLAISAGHFMAVSAGPEQLFGNALLNRCRKTRTWLIYHYPGLLLSLTLKIYILNCEINNNSKEKIKMRSSIKRWKSAYHITEIQQRVECFVAYRPVFLHL